MCCAIMISTMPTVRQNISYAYQDFMFAHRGCVRHLLRSFIVILVIALALETFVFNYNYFATAGYQPISLNDKLELLQDEDGAYLLTEVDHTLEFSQLNTEVHDLWLNFTFAQPAQDLTIKINFTDEAHQTYFDTTEYTRGIPNVQVSTWSGQSKYINLNATGIVNNLRIEIVGDDVRYPILLDDICLNMPHPFNFNMKRFGFTLGVLLLGFAFRPRSAIYRLSIVNDARKSKAAIIFAVVIEVWLMSSFLLMGTNYVGVATKDYNPGGWDGVSVINVFEVGGDNAQQYAELAKSMAEGHLYLNEEPPSWLEEMEDPYDKGARDEAQKATGEKYLFDVAYYDGHYYVYFGVVPVLLFYLPFYLLTGANFPTAIGVLIAVIAFVLGLTALLDRFARYHFKQVSLGLYLLLQIPLVLGCGVLYLLKFPTFYSLPIALGLAFSVWGLYLWTCGRTSEHPCGFYLGGSLCMAAVLGCRPQLLVLSFVAFPLFWRPYITERRLFTPAGIREFLCLVAPYLVVGLGIMYYNAARFGSPFDFGANYNLTVNDMTKRGWEVGRLAPAFFSYFLQPPSVSGVFPFLQAGPFDTTYMGQTVKEPTFGGILACLPILWVLPFARRILNLRIHQRSTKTIAGVIVVLLFGGAVVALADAEMAGILQRYYADFSFMFLASAALLIFIVNENLEVGSTFRDVCMKVLLVLVILTVLYSVLLCFVPEVNWYSDVYDWAYRDIIETVQFWT